MNLCAVQVNELIIKGKSVKNMFQMIALSEFDLF